MAMTSTHRARAGAVGEDERAVWEHEAAATRILVIEDDDRIRETIRLALEDEGTKWTVPTLRRELVMFGQRSPGCAILHLMLPGLNGFECCRALRQSSSVPIVVVTARSDTHDLMAALEAGADDYVWGQYRSSTPAG